MIVAVVIMAMSMIIVIMPMSVPMVIAVAVVVIVVRVAVIPVFSVVVAIVVAIFRALFAAPVVPLPAFMPAPVGVLTATGKRPAIAEARIVMAIDVAVESLGAVEPRTRADEYAACKPLRPVVAKGSAAIRRVIEISIRTHRRRSDIHGDVYFGICL